MRVDKARHHGHAFGIDYLGARTGQVADIAVGADGGKFITFNGKGLCPRQALVDGEYPGIDDYIVWRFL